MATQANALGSMLSARMPQPYSTINGQQQYNPSMDPNSPYYGTGVNGQDQTQNATVTGYTGPTSAGPGRPGANAAAVIAADQAAGQIPLAQQLGGGVPGLP